MDCKQKNHLSKNIYLNYIYSFFMFSDLTRGVWMIFLAGRGFSLIQLGILESVFHLTSLVMEVPTGAVADLWGRKASRIAGRFLFLVSLCIMFFSRSFAMQLLGFVFCAVNYNLESGSGEALLYDSMKLLECEKNFSRVKGRVEFLVQVASVMAFLLGGWLAVRHVGVNFAATAGLALAAVFIGLMFKEPNVRGRKQYAVSLRGMARQTRDSLWIVRGKPRIGFLIFCSEVPFVFAATAFFYLQNFWKSAGFTEFYIGKVFALQCILAGVTSLLAHGIEKRLGERLLLLIAPILVTACMWGIALSSVPWLFFILSGFFEGLLLVTVSGYINKLIPSAYRATILSFQSMVFSFLMILVFPVVGIIGQFQGLKAGFLFMALASTLVALVFIYISRRQALQENSG